MMRCCGIAAPMKGSKAARTLSMSAQHPACIWCPYLNMWCRALGQTPILSGPTIFGAGKPAEWPANYSPPAMGQVHGERYVPIGSEDIDRLIDEIEQKRPDFVLNNLIGNSSYAFFEAYQALGARDPYFLPENCPIVSCNITEAEIDSIGQEQLLGHLTTAVYFETQPNPENQAMLDAVHHRYGGERRGSTYMVSNYTAIKMLAAAIKDTGSDEVDPVRTNLHARRFDTALGPLKIDQWTNHAALRPGVGKFDGLGFEIVSAADELVEADPYFVHFDAKEFARKIAERQTTVPHLRVVK